MLKRKPQPTPVVKNVVSLFIDDFDGDVAHVTISRLSRYTTGGIYREVLFSGPLSLLREALKLYEAHKRVSEVGKDK